MASIAESFDDYSDDDQQTSRQSRPESSRPQADFKRAKPPQRKATGSVSYNGLHRRRKKRIQW